MALQAGPVTRENPVDATHSAHPVRMAPLTQRSCFWHVRRLHRRQAQTGRLDERLNLFLVIAEPAGRGELLAAQVI